MSYPVKDLALEAALDAQNRDQARDFEGDTPCMHTDNEELYQALMDKVHSYNPDKDFYRGQAYEHAAEKVADLTNSIFELTESQQRRLGVGKKTSQFIYDWILANKENRAMPSADQPKKKKKMLACLDDEIYLLERHLKFLVEHSEDQPELHKQFEAMYQQLKQIMTTTY